MSYRSTVAHRRSQAVDRRVMSPARIVAGILGVILLVMGGVALARTGLSSLTGETATVLGFEHTALMGLIDIVAGLLFLVEQQTGHDIDERSEEHTSELQSRPHLVC